MNRAWRVAILPILLGTISAGALAPVPPLRAERAGGEAPPRIDERQLPDEVRENYRVFRRQCGRCHKPDRVLRAPYDTETEWKTVVERMSRLRGARISVRDQQRVVAFLTYYARYLRKPADSGDADERCAVAAGGASLETPRGSPADRIRWQHRRARARRFLVQQAIFWPPV